MTPLTLTSALQQVAANADAYAALTVPTGKWRIKKAWFQPNVAAAADASHYATLTLATNQAAGGSFTACATAITTATVAMAIATPRELVVLATAAGAAALSVPGGAVIRLAKTYTGNGVAAEGVMSVEIEKVPN
jgi:hypothetical protein